MQDHIRVESSPPKVDEAAKIHEVIYYLKKLFENPVAKGLISKVATPKRLEKVLAIYCGAAEASGIKDRVYAKGIAEIVAKAAERFDIDEELLKGGLRDPYYRRGVANVVAGIAKYGITLPQKLYAPFLVVWNFTNRCNLRCKHCYANAGKVDDELTLEEKLDLLRQLDDAGVVAISFSGGEPLIHKDFWKVAEYASKLGFHVSVATNGTLITPEVAGRLKEIVDYVEVSLDAANPATHDEFRGVKGAFERALNGIKSCVDAGILTGIATTATKLNLKEIPEIVSLAERLGVYRLVVFNFIPTGRGKEITSLDLNAEERRWLLEFLYDSLQRRNLQVLSTSPLYAVVSVEKVLEGKGERMTPTHFADVCMPSDSALVLADFLGGCGAGRLYCGIQPNGDITPCVFLPLVVGNYRNGFLKIWQENSILELLRDRDGPDYACKDCDYKYICGGCRARAYGYFGDIRGTDPGCFIGSADV
ncbi:MAG: radical SAM protein [Archaeoglobus sp.]|nr:radical SAM protein [Archaeoglobus sp.]